MGIHKTTRNDQDRFWRTLPHWVCIVLLLTPPQAYGQISADLTAHPSHQPQILSAGQNVPVVNIQTPNGTGVSLNHYSQFDVPTQGAILNNSRVDINSSLAGHIKGNASLAGGTASLILNQVNSPNPSELKGFLEVAGDRASVVVANPSGIMCDGCGFINTPHATLTTGTPLLSGSGALEGYRVEAGTVTFQGKGLNTKDTDYTDILARAIQVNAQVQAGKELRVVAGRNTVTRQGVSTPTATPLADQSHDKPEFALDVAALGGMYAGHIHMVGTEAGVGARISGTVRAEIGDVVLDAHGPITVGGTIQGAKNVRVKAKGDLEASGTLLAQAGDIHIDAEGNLTIGGQVDAKHTVALKAKRITAHKSSNLTAREGTVQILASDIRVGGTVKARDKVDFDGESLDLSQSTLEAQTVSLSARSGTGNVRDAKITVGTRFAAKIAGNFMTDMATITAPKIDITAQNLSNVGGTLTQTGLEAFALKGLSFLDNAQGKIESKGTSFTVEVGQLTNTEGTLFHEGEGSMTVKAREGIVSKRGDISSNGDMIVEAAHMDNEGGLISGVKSLWMRAKSVLNTGTSEDQKGLSSTGTLTLVVDEDLNNTRGLIRTTGALTLTSGFLTHTDGILSSDAALNLSAYGIMATGSLFKSLGAMTINTQGQSFDLTGGILDSRGDFSVTSDAFIAQDAKVVSGQQAILHVGTLRKHDGALSAAEDMRITVSRDLINSQTIKESVGPTDPHTRGIFSGGDLTITTGGTVDNTRGYMGNFRTFTLTTGRMTNTDGVIKGEQRVVMDTQGSPLDNTRGALWANESLRVQTGLLTNTDGVIGSQTTLDITTQGHALDNTRGKLWSKDDLTLTTGLLTHTDGFMATHGNVRMTSGEISAHRGQFASLGAMTINTQGQRFDVTGGSVVVGKFDPVTGAVTAGYDLDITSGDLITDRAQMISRQKATLNVGALRNHDGLIHTQDALEMTASGNVINTQTAKETPDAHQPRIKGMISSGALTLTLINGSMVDNTRGFVSGGRVSVKARAGTVLNTEGTLLALNHLNLEAARLFGDGFLTSYGTLNVDLLGDYTYRGGWTAVGDLTFFLTGGFINQNVLESGGKLTLNTASMDNQASGALVGRGGADIRTGVFTNTGLVNTTEGVIKAGTLINTGGRIYGDRLAIQATHLTNGAENNRGGTIATRSGDLHLGVGTLVNKDGALIYSIENLSIGGSLDGNTTAQGKATRVENRSARIEATQNLFLRAHELLNKNEGLRYEMHTEESFGEKEHLWQDEGWCQFDDRCEHSSYTRVEKPVLLASDPAHILAGQRVILNVDDGENYASQIVGGQGVFYQGGELKNTTLQVKVRQWDGMRTYNRGDGETWDWRYAMVDHGNKERWTEQPHAPRITEKTVDVFPPIITVTSDTPDVPGLGAIGFAPPLPSLSTAALLDVEGASLSALPQDQNEARDVARQWGFTALDIPDVPLPMGEKYTIRTAPFSPDIPMASLFTPRPEPTAMYLVETDPQFTDRKQWLSSDVQLRHMGLDPALAQKRVGDGFYEQMLVRDQLIKLTGYRYFAGYDDDLTQYAALLASGAVFGKQHTLTPGVALTGPQMAKLTSPIVWLVKRPVRLKDGSVHEVLVPQVYAVVRPGALRGDGALISGRQVKMVTAGALLNKGGTIAGQERTEISADTIANLMGRVGDGGRTTLASQQDTVNIGGAIQGGSVSVNAGRDFISQTITKTNESQSGEGSNFSHVRTTNVDRVASVTATDREGSLTITSGRDSLLIGSEIHNQGTGDTTLAAGRHLTADTVQTREERQTRFHREKETFLAKTSVSGTDHTVESQSVGTKIAGQGAVTITSGGDSTYKNTQITSGGKTTLSSTGTTTFVEDREIHFSQTTRSKVGILWQKQKDTGEHKDTGARTTITAGGGSTTTAGSGVVTETATVTNKTWNEKKESMTPLGSALVGLVITGATFLSGGTAAGALGILNPMGASALNAGVASFGTQLALGTINNKGDIGKALEGISVKQVAVSMGSAGISAGVISAFTPGVVPRLDPNFRAGAGAGTSFSDMGLTQSASFAGTATQATSASTWASGFVSRLPAHGIQTITNMGANAILSDGDVKAVRNAALGSLATIVGTEATLPLGQAYHAGQVNPFVHKVLHGGIGAGTAAISGGNIWAGAAGAVAGEVAGQFYLGTQTPTLQNANLLTNQAANIGRIAGGLAGLVAGRDPNTGANTGTIASENNAVQFIPLAIAAGSAAYTAWQGDGNPLKGLEKIGVGNDPLSQAVSSGVEQGVELSAQHFPEATQRAIQVLSTVGNAVDATVTYVDQATGQTVSRTWNSLDVSTQNMLKGAGKVLGVSLSAAQVGKISSIAKGAQVGTKVDGPWVPALRASVPNEIRTSSGIVIKPNPEKVTTVLGTFQDDMERIINQDIKRPKDLNYTSARKGEFNVLNTPDHLYQQLGPDGYWEKVNKPFLDAAINRGDDIVMATKPDVDTLERTFNNVTSPTGFGREYNYLLEKGYRYDTSSSYMRKD